MSRLLWVGAAALVTLVGSAGAQPVTINGLNQNPRVFNDYPDSNLTINTNGFPSSASIRDEFVTTPSGKFANRHDLLLSSDGGATAATFNNNESFDIKADVTLTDGSDTPRKETGIRVNSSVGGDGLFIVNSDAHEIVAFGGPFPFFRFNNATFSYTTGDTITMEMIYDAAGHTMDYQVTKGGMHFDSGPLAFTNTENGVIDGSTAGFYGQFSPSGPGDFGNLVLANMSATANVVPEPVSIAALGGLALGLFVRRRKAPTAL